MKGAEQAVNWKPGSLYWMTRKSQEFFTHRIDKGSIEQGTRYSLTFRCVNWKNRNSTAIIGDSNTGMLHFGTNKYKSFGELMPGQKFWAPLVEDINPETCCGYNNVVIQCGINNLKQDCMSNRENIDKLYQATQRSRQEEEEFCIPQTMMESTPTKRCQL
ncbi:hypothetical protein ACHWQZ_G012691 [Mnemiopsis leidyi]